MTAADTDIATTRSRSLGRDRFLARLGKAEPWLRIIGLGWSVALVKAALGESPRTHLRQVWRELAVPLLAILAFLTVWGALAPQVRTSLGTIPGPAEVWQEALKLHEDARIKAVKKERHRQRVAERNRQLIAAGQPEKVRDIPYTGAPSFYDQIWTSIKTVFFGFALAAVIAIPLGILAGLSPTASAAMSPLVQIFKPVSPLAWLPLVTIIVSAVYVGNGGLFSKSFLISGITVTLCSLWPTLINTSLGVASIDKDLINVSKVLKMDTVTKLRKLVLPSALPLIFTGLRLTLGVGWMVLIAAEMLAQNPGLGKFVWDEFQNGSSQSLARIMVAVFTIGIIGFLLDRVMYALQTLFTFTNDR